MRLKKGAKQEGCLTGGAEGVVTRDIYKERGVPEYAVKTSKGSTLYNESQLELVHRDGNAKVQRMVAQVGSQAAFNVARAVQMSAATGKSYEMSVDPSLAATTTIAHVARQANKNPLRQVFGADEHVSNVQGYRRGAPVKPDSDDDCEA